MPNSLPSSLPEPQPANILAIDTSTEACSVALQVGDKQLSRYKFAPREHGDLVLPMVDELLVEAGIKLSQLDLIAYGQGPGAFTGLRICISIVQGLAYGADVPVAGVSSLQAMAQAAYQASSAENVFAAIDARMGEVYWGQYQLSNGLMELIGEERVCLPQDVTYSALETSKNKELAFYASGSGWQTYSAELSDALPKSLELLLEEKSSFPQAKAMLGIAQERLTKREIGTAEQAQPVYLRNNVAKKKQQQTKQAS